MARRLILFLLLLVFPFLAFALVQARASPAIRVSAASPRAVIKEGAPTALSLENTPPAVHRVLSVHEALTLCVKPTSAQLTVTVLGKYVRWPAIGPRGAYKRGDASLFDSADLPPVPPGRWVGPYWSKHGGMHLIPSWSTQARYAPIPQDDWVAVRGALACTARPPFLRAASWQPWTALPGSPGVQLSVTLARKTYPRHALIEVTVQARNVSAHPVPVFTGWCPFSNPYIQAVDSRGLLSKGQRQWFIGTFCRGPEPGERPLPAGGTVTRKNLVVLWTPRLRPVILMPGWNGQVVGRTVTLATYQSAPPIVRLQTGPILSASIRPATPQQHGPLMYRQIDDCSPAGLTTMLTGITATSWKRAYPSSSGAYLFRPRCTPLRGWHVVAGWLNQPVATVDYVKR